MGAGLSAKAKEALKNCEKEGKTELNFSDCGLSKVKNFRPVLRLKNLTYLNLEHNLIVELPSQFDKLRHLRHINLRDNRIIELNDGILVMDTLEKFNVAQNQLSVLPSPIGRLAGLTDLDISYNDIKELPNDFPKLRLVRFAYAGNKLKELPPCVWECRGITFLNVHDNQLTVLKPDVARLEGLTHLDLGHNELQELSPVIAKLVHLTYLDVSENKLTVLPNEVCKLPKLQVLKASQNKLETLESLVDIRDMQALEELYLDHNRLRSVHPGLGFCGVLKNLDLSHNQLTVVPKQIGWLDKSLRKLILSFNQIVMLPGDLSFLNPALRLELDQNPLDPVINMNFKRGTPILLDSLAASVLAYPEHCVAFGDALVNGRAGVGETFKIKAFDRMKREIKSGKDSFECKMVRVRASEVDEAYEYQCILKNHKNGEYSVFYNVARTGLYKTHVTQDSIPILGSPFDTLIEPGPADPCQCTAAGKGLCDGPAGQTVSFSIITRDKLKNMLSVGGADVKVVIVGGSNPTARIADNKDGSYTVTYTLGWADTYNVEVYVNGKALDDSPFRVVASEK